MNQFARAERRKSRLRLAICGPSGSGKTYSALLMAKGLAPNGKIALIDTESGSGELYADLLTYDVASLEPPFSPSRYIDLIRGASKEYEVLIIDSLSHAWTGQGGVLDMHDKATAADRAKNSFAAWRLVTPKHNELVDAVLTAPLHIITTMRTKTAYEIVEENGKKKPIKVGLAPVQRDGMEYEFTLVFDLSVDGHIATASKDRTSLFDGQHFVPSVNTGEQLLNWLNTGTDAAQVPPTKAFSGQRGSQSAPVEGKSKESANAPFPLYSDKKLDSNREKWRNMIETRRSTANTIIDAIRSKYILAEDQACEIRKLELPAKSEHDDFYEEGKDE